MNQPSVNPPATSQPQPEQRQPRSGADRAGSLPFALSVALCTLLGVNLMVMAFGRTAPASAGAQVTSFGPHQQPSGVIPPPENIPSAPASSPEMLKRLIEQQIETNARLARIEATVAGPHSVTVTNWPAQDKDKK